MTLLSTTPPTAVHVVAGSSSVLSSVKPVNAMSQKSVRLFPDLECYSKTGGAVCCKVMPYTVGPLATNSSVFMVTVVLAAVKSYFTYLAPLASISTTHVSFIPCPLKVKVMTRPLPTAPHWR